MFRVLGGNSGKDSSFHASQLCSSMSQHFTLELRHEYKVNILTFSISIRGSWSVTNGLFRLSTQVYNLNNSLKCHVIPYRVAIGPR